MFKVPTLPSKKKEDIFCDKLRKISLNEVYLIYIYERIYVSVCMSVYQKLLNGRSSDDKIWHKCSLTIWEFN